DDSGVLTATANTRIESQQAADIAARLVGGPDKVVNSIVVRGRDQVMLKVTVVEIQRTIIKHMGTALAGSLTYGTTVLKFANSTPFTANNAPLVPNNSVQASF